MHGFGYALQQSTSGNQLQDGRQFVRFSFISHFFALIHYVAPIIS
jgi:hypothetical protein